MCVHAVEIGCVNCGIDAPLLAIVPAEFFEVFGVEFVLVSVCQRCAAISFANHSGSGPIVGRLPKVWELRQIGNWRTLYEAIRQRQRDVRSKRLFVDGCSIDMSNLTRGVVA